MGQREGRQAADPEALVLPGQHVVGQVDFLVDHGELDLRVLTGGHLRGNVVPNDQLESNSRHGSSQINRAKLDLTMT